MNRRNFLQLLPSALVALLPVSQDGEPDLDVPQAHSDIDYEELAQALLDTPLEVSARGLWDTPYDPTIDDLETYQRSRGRIPHMETRAFHIHPTDSGGPASDTHNHNI